MDIPSKSGDSATESKIIWTYLWFKNACKRDGKAINIEPNDWKKTAEDWSAWKQSVKHGMKALGGRRAHWAQKKNLREIPARHSGLFDANFTW